MKVKIGIVPALDEMGGLKVEHQYMDYVTGGGAEAVVLPCPITSFTEAAIRECDGFLFLGGADLDPSRYGEEATEALGKTIPARDEYEFEIFKLIFNTGKPIFAVCRGTQLINCALGGSLYQDLFTQRPSAIQHRDTTTVYDNYHTARFHKGTYLYGILGGEEFTVNSYHHQAIRVLGDGLAVMASAPDGLIEAVYHTGDRILWGFQWHPERIRNEASERIIKAFISACGDAGRRREVRVTVDRPIGSRHPVYQDTVYELNYGYVPGVIGGDGEEQDAYIIGIVSPLREFVGELIAVIHRKEDNECKWVVAPIGRDFSEEEIRKAVDFQEKYFESYIEVLE